MPIRLNDDHCLLWIKDPSISPFKNNYMHRIHRKDILSEDTLKNPKSFLNKIKRKCFYNSVLRQKIVEQIKEYQRLGTLRLYTLNDKLSDILTDTIEYITPPFTIKDCKKWANNHTINPKTNLEIHIVGRVYIELIYTTLQYGLPTPPILNTVPTDEDDKILYELANKIIKNVLYRLEFMKQNDEYFLNHDVESFDRKLNIALPITPGHRAARVAAIAAAKPNNSFGVSASSTSYKSLNSAERRQLRDIALENKEERKLVAEYQFKKGLVHTKKDIDKTVFAAFREFLEDLQSSVNDSNELINNILQDATENAKESIKAPIISYIQNKIYYDYTLPDDFLKNNNLDNIEGIISNFINNIYAQLLDPSFFLTPYMAIACLSYNNKKTFYNDAELINNITNDLFDFIDTKYEFGSYDKTPEYFHSIVVDIIPYSYVAKRVLDIRSITGTRISNSNYQNLYYKMLLRTTKEPKIIRLPEGRGLLIGKKLRKAIYDLDEVYFNHSPEDSVITDDNPLNGFTYEECKDWVIMPIINPRTFKPILIDSPIYNRLLCMSYQYDTNLIPRMITSRGYKIIEALTEVIEDILKNEGKIPQSREQLEQFIIDKERQFAAEKEMNIVPNNVVGSKWKYVGTKKPKAGVEIINKKLTEAFRKSNSPESATAATAANSVVPFYVFFKEEDLAKFGITDIAKKSYVEIATYYVPVSGNKSSPVNRLSSPVNRLGLKWQKVAKQSIDGIEKEGIQIINKKIADVLLKLKDSKVLFTETEFAKFGIKSVATNSYIKIAKYYIPVVERRASDFVAKSSIKNKSPVITKRHEWYKIYNYYTVMDCLRWAQQPNRDPKHPGIIFETDDKEYNAIFEQALLYDYDIVPINITPKGLKFKKLIYKTKKLFLTIAKYAKHPKSKGLDIAEINTKICNAIKNIFDDETKEEGKNYKKFKYKMIEKCEQYNKKPAVCIEIIKERIEDYFQYFDTEGQYNINYYQDSALASLVIKYEGIKGELYNEGLRDIFIQDFNKFYIKTYEIDDNLDEYRKRAIDAGGPKREFFTKLFEEMFCDDEHLTRPFISPPDIIENKYYINPNFAPDENFRKVINAYTKNNNSGITQFNTERDYEYMYYVIGKILCITVYNEDIGLPKQFSDYILAGFINQQSEFDYYDMLYFYLKEFENAKPLINLVSNNQIDYLDDADLSFNRLYQISRATGGSQDTSGVKINKGNCIKFLLQQANHVVTKNFLGKGVVNSGKSMKKRYTSLFAGFSNEMRKFLYKEKVSISQLSLLITNEQLTVVILQEFADKFVVKMELFYLPETDPAYDPNDKMTDQEKGERADEMKGYIRNIITQRRANVSEKDHFAFIKNLLRFWCGLTYFNKKFDYKVFYKYGWRINVNKLPEAHTCSNQLDMYGFPVDTADKIYTPAMKEEFIYKKLLLAVGEQQMEMQ